MPYRVVIWVQRAHERDRASERRGRKWTTERFQRGRGNEGRMGNRPSVITNSEYLLPSYSYTDTARNSR